MQFPVLCVRIISSFHVLFISFFFSLSLSDLLGQDGEKSVPLRVWLYPLKLCKELNSNTRGTHVVAADIGFSDLDRAEKELQDLKYLSAELDELRIHPAAQKLMSLQRILNAMADNLNTFRSEFRHRMATLVTKVRGGMTEECILADLINERIASPYNGKKFREWLENKEREASALKQCCGLESTVIPISKLDELRADCTVKYVVS